MLRFIILTALAAAASLAQAADAGKVIFVTGKATIAETAAAEGAPVQEGQMLSTGPDGFLYVKTVDNGLFILRPNSQARIVTYHVDTQHPENTRVKFELLNGVARSKSGNAVKQARQNFRFNTPVAAIGVRGTDFTVFTDNDTSRVAVLSGAIVMSGFAGDCRMEGTGPCGGNLSRELTAQQRGQLLQVQRGQASAPKLLDSSPLSPDQVSPPRADEPLAHTSGTTATGKPNLDAEKTASLNNAIEKAIGGATPPAPVTPPVVTPPVVIPPPLVDNTPQLPERDIIWGRWTVVAGSPPKLLLVNAMAQNELLAQNGDYALLRTPGKDYVAPNNGNIGFKLADSEAFIYTTFTPTYRTESKATLTNGALNVDFGSKSFSTTMDLLGNGSQATRLQANGTVTADGQLRGDAAGSRVGYMNVQGVLSNANGGSASYIFDSRLDDKRTVNGGTYWQQIKH
nr:FecR family protein [uncultured Massilia sp.]